MSNESIEKRPLVHIGTGDLFGVLDRYGFECEAGPLSLCEHWRELKHRVNELEANAGMDEEMRHRLHNHLRDHSSPNIKDEPR